MTLYRFSFPIPDYYGEAIFPQFLYVEAENYPTKEQVQEILLRKHNEDIQYPEYLQTWNECLKCLETLEKWPNLRPGLLETNSFCETEKFGQYPFVVEVIVPERI